MLLKNAYITDPQKNDIYKASIRLENGLISSIGEELLPQDGEEVLELAGLHVAPGLIDTHVHFRDPGFTHKEDLHTGALAAAAGGFTTVICMANTRPVVDSVQVLKDILTRAEGEMIRIYQAASVTEGLKGQRIVPMELLKNAGAVGFTDDGIPIRDAALLYDAMRRAAALHMPVSLHEEDPSFIENNGINRGHVSEALGIGGSPAIAEEVLVARDLLLAERSGAEVVIQHISSGLSVALVRAAKARGAHVHAEATPHHFSLTDEAVLEYGSLAKMNPPLRTEADRQAIIEGLKDGTIDIIATDHAPHSREEKARPLTEAPSGIIGLETSLALGITSLVKPGYLTLPQLIKKMTSGPAELYHLPGGEIAPGAPADLVAFDPEEVWTPRAYASKSANSPFTGRKLTGRVHMTICGGKPVFRLLK